MKTKPVLIVDDEENVRNTLSKTLRDLEIETDNAVNGKEALQKLKEKKFDMVFLDLNMPDMNGLDVLRKISEERPEIHVIIITAHGTIESAVEAMKLGAIDFIQKPIAPKEIKDLVAVVKKREELDEKKAEDYESYIELVKRAIENKNFEAANEWVKKAISLDPIRPEAFNLLGVLSEISGDSLQAQKLYRATLALDPSYDPANENLTRLTGGPEEKGEIKTEKD
jgi:DNA-binding NtrC family response regulator